MVDRFLDYWQPDLALFAESEIWPVTIMELGAPAHSADSGECPHFRPFLPAVVDGAAAWPRRCSRICRWSIAQSEADAQRFQELRRLAGADLAAISRPTATCRPADPLHGSRAVTDQLAGRNTWAAISTFDGEEKAAAQVHTALKTSTSRLRSIVVPAIRTALTRSRTGWCP